jgi:hypothetical protein
MNPYAFPGHPDGNNGMSLRDYFAAAALQGLLERDSGWAPETVAEVSYAFADAMLEERTI